MDIRIIDGLRVVNVSRLSLEVQGRYVVGLTEDGKQVNVKTCVDEESANELLNRVITEICRGVSDNKEGIVIFTTLGEGGGEENGDRQNS